MDRLLLLLTYVCIYCYSNNVFPSLAVMLINGDGFKIIGDVYIEPSN